jgi:exopolysaccharide biosynthesis polyprenyl glycosylphosphotransferase
MVDRKENLFRQATMLADVATLVISYVAAYSIRSHLITLPGPLRPLHYYLIILWVAVPAWILAGQLMRLYESATFRSQRELFKRVTQVQVVCSLILLSCMYLAMRLEISRLLVEAFLLTGWALLLAEKLAIRICLQRFALKRGTLRLWRALVVGEASLAQSCIRLLGEHPHWGVEVVDVLSPDAQPAQFGEQFVAAQDIDWHCVLRQYVVDEVIAVTRWQRLSETEPLAMACAVRGITFRAMLAMPEWNLGEYRVSDLGKGNYLLSLEVTPQAAWQLLAKRALDIAGALAGLSLFAIAYLWYGWRLVRESPGPVIFRQQRVGQNGRRFELLKFRTMHVDAESRLNELLARNEMKGHMFKMENDPRVTRVGRILRRRHIDELPQFWNVLKGEMSLVGTRPPTVNEFSKYDAHHCRRLSMKPGLTGLWQLSGNGTVHDFEEVVKLDCGYIDSWSLWLDCKILTTTLIKVLRGTGW